MTIQSQERNDKWFWFIVVFIILVMGLGTLITFGNLELSMLEPVEVHTSQPVNAPGGYAQSLPEVQITGHALYRHSTEGLAAELCNQTYGVKQVRYDKHRDNFLLLCETPEGDVFVQVIERISEMFYKQKTAFRYTNQQTGKIMNWNEVMNYLDKFTTRWTKPLP